MAGMRALGRLFDTVPNASGVAVCLRDCSGIEIETTTTTTAATSVALTAATTFGGSYVNVVPGSGFGQPNTWYLRSATGTAAWVAQSAVWTTNSLALGGTAGNVSVFDFLVSELADTYVYLKATGTNCVVNLRLYDLTSARTPANLRIPSA